jgi:hypothetical protein
MDIKTTYWFIALAGSHGVGGPNIGPRPSPPDRTGSGNRIRPVRA